MIGDKKKGPGKEAGKAFSN